MQGEKRTSKRTDHSWIIDTLLLTLTIGVFFFILLGSRPLFVPDEGRYSEIAREMVTRQDYITPYLNSIKYFEKPAMFYWLGAAAIKIGGLNLWSLRSINAIIGLLGCLLTYFTTRKLYGRTAGLASAIILSTSTLYFVMSHMISLDLPVTVFIAASLYGLILSTQESNPGKCRLYLIAAAAAAALAVLTKGLIGVVFPAMIAATWIIILGEWRQLKRLPIISAFIVFLIIAVPWHLLVNYHNPEFFHFYFIEQHILRYTTMDIGHYQPVWFFIPVLILSFFPWITFLPFVLANSLPRAWHQRHKYKTELFFVIWATLVFIFFSFSKSKLIPYILPIIPALAVLTGKYIGNRLERSTIGLKLGYACLTIFAIVIACLLWRFTSNVPFPDPANVELYLRTACSLLVIGTVISLILSFRRPLPAFILATISTALFLLITYAAVPFIDSRTIKPLTITLKTTLKPEDDVITFNQYYQDLPFYLERRVTILNWKNELSFGMRHQNTQEWMINNFEFWQRWHSKRRVYVIMSKDEYRGFRKKYPTEKIFIIDETATNALVTNSPLGITPS